jgi:hypothetical protein
MTKTTTGERLNRYNLLLADAESAWLDKLCEEIHTQTGAKVSRSEIVRAAIAGIRELHRLSPECPSRFGAAHSLQERCGLAIALILAIQWATGGRTEGALRHGRIEPEGRSA